MSNQAALAALRVRGAWVDLLGVTYDVPALPAARWFELVLSEKPLWLLDLLGPEASSAALRALLFGETTVEELAGLARELLGLMAGLTWWEADRLIRGAAAQWRIIGGELTRRGVDLESISLAAALNTIYVVCVRTMTEEERTRFEFQLRLPPEGIAPEEAVDMQASVDAFVGALGPPPNAPRALPPA